MPRKPLFPKQPKPAATPPASPTSPPPAAPKKKQPVVREMLAAARAAGVQSVGAIIDHFFDLKGGQREVARLLADEYDASKAGSLTRARILDLILRHMRALEERAGVARDAQYVNQGDLDREIAQLGEKILGGRRTGRPPTLDPEVPPTEGPDAPVP